MRFTWGHAAVAIPVTIVVVFTTVLIRSMSDAHKTELVAPDYYAREIRFQEQMDKNKNAIELHTQLTFDAVEMGSLLLLKGDYLPEQVIGELTVYRPSDSKLDFTIPIKLDSNYTQFIARKLFEMGSYQIQLNWSVNGRACYLEKNIFIQ